MKVILTILLLFVLSSALAGDSMDTRMRHWLHPGFNYFAWNKYNPALASLKPLPELSTVRLQYAAGDQINFHLQQDGEGYHQYKAIAAGHRHEGPYSLQGGLTYSNQTTRGIRWSNVTDPDLTGPYLLADSLGGTAYSEQYHLWGSASRQYGHYAFQMNMGYRALGAYRKKDSRANIKVSDFKIGSGVARQIGNYAVGISFEYQRYRQYASVRNYKDDGRALTYFYILNGLGFYSDILSGSEYNYGIQYHGAGYSIAFQWVPKGQSGLYLMGRYAAFNNEMLRGHNTYGAYSRKDWQAEGGYRMAGEHFSYTLKANVDYLDGDGAEYLYKVVVVDEESRETDYQLLSKLPKYAQKEQHYVLSLLTTYADKGYLLSAEAAGGFHAEEETYQKGTYFTRIHKGVGHLALQGQKFSAKAIWELTLKGQMSKNIAAEKHLLSPDTEASRYVVTRLLVLPDYDYKRQHLYRVNASLSLLLPVKKDLLANLKLTYERVAGNHRWNQYLAGSVGLFF